MALERSFIPKLAKKARLRFDRHSGKLMLIYPERGLALNESAAKILSYLLDINAVHEEAFQTEVYAESSRAQL